jgi:hypothetical protein
MSEAARRRVQQKFSETGVVDAYLKALAEIA